MAIPFLNNINLSDNQLLNAKLQVTSTAPTAAVGQIYFDSGATELVAKYYSGGWINISDTSVTGSTFITATESGTNAEPVYQVSLSASGTPDSTVYLRGDNTWSPISAIPGTYTWTVSDGSNSEAIASGDTVTWSGTGTTTVTYATATNTFTINSADQYTGTVTAVGTQNSTFISGSGGPILGSGSLTYSLSATGTPSSSTYLRGDNTWAALPADPTITLTGEVTGSGTTSISTTVANNVLDIDNFTAATIVTESEGIANNDNDTTLPTSAAVKAYVDDSVAGGLVYQGGYNASTNTPDLTTSPNSIEKGWTYTVTADGTFFSEQLRVGDVLIAEQDDPSALADWTTVQNNIDLASLTQVGIGNVNAATASSLLGIDVGYSSGTASVGLDIKAMTTGDTAGDAKIPYFEVSTNSNKSVNLDELAPVLNSKTSFSATISATGTITHSLGTRDVIIQLYDTVTYETVYADVDRISTTQATITFASTPTNSIRVLVQKIG